jgi:predicted NodU family carbamoyl transferase
LLNTSFNTKGKPMLTTVGEALLNPETVDLDCLVVEDTIHQKRNLPPQAKLGSGMTGADVPV